jgi:4-carboxymuconolactone decarboxylase
MVNSVSFAAGARTHWHSHRAGQILIVVSGGGTVAGRDGSRSQIATGDIVHVPPGVEHWHGARPACAMTHLAISIQETDWLEAVSEADYLGA